MGIEQYFTESGWEVVSFAEIGNEPLLPGECKQSNPLTKPAYDDFQEKLYEKGWADSEGKCLIPKLQGQTIIHHHSDKKFYFVIVAKVKQEYFH